MVVFPAPVGPTDGDAFPRFNICGKIIDYGLSGQVAELDISELHMAADLGVRCVGLGFRLFLFLVEELKNAFRRCGRLLENIGYIGYLADGLSKGAHILMNACISPKEMALRIAR